VEVNIELADFGSYYIGGSKINVTEGEPTEIQFTRDSAYLRDPKGHYAMGQLYVQFFCPRHRNQHPKVVLIHGGGMCGTTWETTPDGRPGWLHMLLVQGYEVHVVDCVERGRAGFSTMAYEGSPIERSLEEAWSLFRFGTTENFNTRTAFADQQFPIKALDYFANYFVPRWLSTSQLQVDALVMLLEKLGQSVLITHSQGGELGFDAAQQKPQSVAGIIAIEPSSTSRSLDAYRHFHTVIVQGDYLSSTDRWSERADSWQTMINQLNCGAARGTLVDLPTKVGPGNSHFPMMDFNSEACLDVALCTFNQPQLVKHDKVPH